MTVYIDRCPRYSDLAAIAFFSCLTSSPPKQPYIWRHPKGERAYTKFTASHAADDGHKPNLTRLSACDCRSASASPSPGSRWRSISKRSAAYYVRSISASGRALSLIAGPSRKRPPISFLSGLMSTALSGPMRPPFPTERAQRREGSFTAVRSGNDSVFMVLTYVFRRIIIKRTNRLRDNVT
jgi:hypothetical protein